MVATLENTMRKWHAVRNALRRTWRGKLKGSFHVREHNAPTANQVYGHYNNALANAPFNINNPMQVRIWFTLNPNKRQHITAAYNKLNNMARELAGVRRKAVAATVLQRRWRAAHPGIMNKRKVTALRALSAAPGVRNTRRVAFEMAFPRPVYGPKTEWQHLRSHNKYPAY
jgi:hypothetical protein